MPETGFSVGRVTPRRWCAAWLLAAGAGACAGTAAAAEGAPCPGEGADLDTQLAAVSRCQNEPVFLSRLGHALIAQRRYAEAAEHLERAVLLDPRLKGAQIDFAIALAGVGDTASALSLVDSLLAEPGVPDGLADALRQQRRTLLAQASNGVARTAWRRSASVRVGHDSNLFGSPNLASLTLTFADVAVELPLDPSYKARAGGYLRGDASIEMRHDNGGGVRYDAYASVRARYSAVGQAADAQQVELVGERTAPLDALRAAHYLTMGLNGFHTRGGVRYTARSLAWGLERAQPGAAAGGSVPNGTVGASCRLRGGVEWQDRVVASNTVLSGRYTGLQGQWRCAAPDGGLWQVSGQWGRERAQQSSRPGGDQVQTGLRGTRLWPARQWAPAAWVSAGDLQLDAEYSRSSDRAGYSPLLESGRIRQVDRWSLRVELQQRQGPNTQWLWGVEWLHQRSNLSLFSVRSVGPYVALRSVW